MTTTQTQVRSTEEALKLALDALEDRASLMKWQMARDAVKEALAQPEPPPEWMTEEEQTAYTFGWFKALESQRIAHPEQKPVAWLQFKENEPPVVVPRDLGTPVFLGIRGGLAHDTQLKEKNTRNGGCL